MDEHEGGIEGEGAQQTACDASCPVDCEGHEVKAKPVEARTITQAQLCMRIGQTLERMLLTMTGSTEGNGPAFALILWTDGQQPVDFSTNRTRDEIFARAMAVVSHIAAEQRESQKPPVIVVPH